MATAIDIESVDEADQIRSAGIERPSDAELADEQEIVLCGIVPVQHAQALDPLPATLLLGTETRMPSFSRR